MARKNKIAGRKRVFDTRMSFKRMCNVLGLTPIERVKLYKRVIKEREVNT